MPRRACAGFTYIGLLLAVAFIGAGLAAIGQVWHTNVQRSREAELLFIGEQFKRAIKLYYDSTPGGDKQLPKTLEDLLRDARYPVVRRYLRKVYVDPMRGKAEWGLIKHNNGDGILGVYSLSEGTPFKNGDAAAASKQRVSYADWRFVADVALSPVAVAAQPPPNVIAQPTPAPEPVAAPPDTLPDTPPVAIPATPRPKPLPTERCERLREMDARACAASASRRGSPDSGCESSAASRYANCTAGVPVGPLWIAQ